jgi:5-methylcytosine-specific restriction endonuclease McrA
MTAVLELPVLVLNRNWQPVHTCSSRRALHLLCLGHAQVVQVDGDEKFSTHDLASWIRHSRGVLDEEMIHGVKLSLRVPKILVLGVYDKLPRLEVKFTRRNVFLRDRFTCQYCSKILPESQLNLDHVLPRDKGGRTTWENIVTSCVRCNTRKANKLTHEVNMHPLRKPVAPRWRPLFGMHENGLADESWSHFIAATSGEKMSA